MASSSNSPAPAPAPALAPAGPASAPKKKNKSDKTKMPKSNNRRLDEKEKNVLVHLLQVPKLTNIDIAKIIKVDERTISRRRKQLKTLGHLSPEKMVKGAEKMKLWHTEKVLELLEQNNDLPLKDIQAYLAKEFDLHVTISTISRQMARQNKARCTRPGYKAKRPDLQPPAPSPEELQRKEEEKQRQLELQQQQEEQDQEQEQKQEQQRLHQQQMQVQLQQQQNVGAEGKQDEHEDEHEDTQVAVGQQLQQTNTGERRVMLGCPFYKQDPDKYQDGPFCRASWPGTRDVKEHVFRHHAKPKHRCNRCMETFENSYDLMNHHRTPQPCPLREIQPVEGIDDEQDKKLRRAGPGDEIEKWKRMYRVLFPGVSPMFTPNPVVYESAYFSVEEPSVDNDASMVDPALRH